MNIAELINKLSNTNTQKEALEYIIDYNYNDAIQKPENWCASLLPRIHSLLGNEDVGIRSLAAFTLSKTGNRSSIPFLANAWSETQNDKGTEEEVHHLKRQILIALADIDEMDLTLPVFHDFEIWEEKDKALALECFGNNLRDILPG